MLNSHFTLPSAGQTTAPQSPGQGAKRGCGRGCCVRGWERDPVLATPTHQPEQ